MELEKKLKGTQSEKNVMEAFSGESRARNKYAYYAQQAHDAGNDKIACLFDAMAKNEQEHARVWFNLLYGGPGTIEENLVAAAMAENEEWKTTYPSYAKQAREEGFEMLAMLFEKIAAIENDHEKRFQEALAELRSGQEDTASQGSKDTMPVKNKAAQATGSFRCMFCGNVESVQLEECPVCGAAGCYEAI